jgi:hypothetical protein
MADFGGEFQVVVGCLRDTPTCFLPMQEEGAGTEGVGAGSCRVCVCVGGDGKGGGDGDWVGRHGCGDCGGDGETGCYTCDSTGKVESSDSSEVIYTDFVSWSGRWKMYFANIKHHEQIDTEDSNNFYNNNQTLIMREYYEISEEYEGYENGDTFLFHMNENPELINRDSNGVVRI